MLQGHVVVGGATVFNSEKEKENTLLCHMWLGHISERDMIELHRKDLLKGLKTFHLNFFKYCVLGKQAKI